MKSLFVCFVLVLLLTDCKKILSTGDSSDTLSNEEVFNNEHSANAIVVNMYADPMKAVDILNGLLSRHLGLAADELQSSAARPSDIDLPWFNCEVPSTDKTLAGFWSRPYEYIYQANNILENLSNNTKLNNSVKQRLTGEALFIRALNYFYLVNLFGGVPLVVKTDYKENIHLPRESEEAVYRFIINDLQQAELLLPEYTPGSDSALLTGVRATKWAAKALLARAFLYHQEWEKAEQYAGELINSGRFRLETNLNNVFSINSKEVIFQLQPVKLNQNSAEAIYFLPSVNTQPPMFVIRQELLSRFETGDLRRKNWIGSIVAANKTQYFPLKYKTRNSVPAKEYNVVFRLGEAYLIQAEAQAMQGKLYGGESAAATLKLLRVRAGLSSIPNGLTQQQILQRIEQERKAELFAEWGHRWFDLRRTKSFHLPGVSRAEEILKSLKPSFQPYRLLLPIPLSELQKNTALVQNDGYR